MMRIKGLETRCWPPLAAVLFTALLVPRSASAQSDAAGVARRVAAIVSIAAEEYALGVDDQGQVISPAELEEARLFLDEALAAAAELPTAARSAAMPQVRALVDLVASRRPPVELRAGLAVLRTRLRTVLGVSLDPMPRSPPSLIRGAQLFESNCTKCHGDGGAGDGPRAAELDPRPANLTDRVALRGSSPLDFYRKVTFGIAGTDMAAFDEGLTLDERWAVALYTSGLRYANEDDEAGVRWFADRCDSCRLWISDFGETARLSDDSLASLLAVVATPPPEALAYARVAASADLLGNDRGLSARRVARKVTLGVDEAVTLALAGDTRGAVRRAVRAYLQFEQVENAVAARNAGAARGVELAFAELRSALDAGAADRIVTARGQLDGSLLHTVDVMSAASSPALLFGQSLLIILREGLEAMLIVAALAAFVVKAGARRRLREITGGVVVALVASALTAAALVSIWRLSATHREVLEGANMLLASAVLFVVASWLVSKVESEKWKRYMQRQMSIALSAGSALALAGVAFLAVYREGFETVLFYGALFGTAEDALGSAGIVAGLAVGLVCLVGVYVGIQRYGMRIPLRPFFAVTGILLTILSVSFAGQGVAEWQAAGWVPSTPINLPSLPALGVFPTVQTWMAQLVLAAAFGVALAWIFLVSPRLGAAALPRPER